jgi:hypothetical protein
MNQNKFLIKAKNFDPIFLIVFSLLVSSCVTPGSFKVNKLGPGSNRAMVLSQLTQNNPYVIVHEGDSAWQLDNYKLNDDNTAVNGELKTLPSERYGFKNVNPNGTNIAPDTNSYPFDEMHVKITGLIIDSTGKVVLHNDSIKEIQVYNKINYKKKNAETTAATVGLGVGVTILIIVGSIALIAALIALGIKLSKDILSGD